MAIMTRAKKIALKQLVVEKDLREARAMRKAANKAIRVRTQNGM